MEQNACIIWDWNGTILDDTAYSVGVINQFLAARSLAPLTVERYRRQFSFPVKDFYAGIGLDLEGDEGITMAKKWNDIYYDGVMSCQMRQGAEEVLSFFYRSSIPQYIVSAAEHVKLNALVDRLKIRNYFKQVLGVADNLAQGKLHLVESIKNEFEGKRLFVVGDTVHDYELSQSISAQAVLLSTGHQSEERLKACAGATIIQTLSELPPIILPT